MGGKWSKRAAWQAARERMVRTELAADGVEKHEAQEDEEVGIPVKPSLFKRKGGLEGLIIQGYFPD
uniref:Truncated nef protein n=1 Tax=Human immunodeficiency virus type 1 TaxID=11676 RepID=B6V902_HV1|nr:truncated nef protein [Human immunodeficiency virus 1]